MVHHKSKASDSRVNKSAVKGSQSIESKARVVLDLVQLDGEMSCLTLTKGNGYSYEEKQKSWKIEFDPFSRTFRATGDFIRREYLEEMLAPKPGGEQKNEVIVEWPDIFQGEEFLKYKDLVSRVERHYGCVSRTADRKIQAATGEELEKGPQGYKMATDNL